MPQLNDSSDGETWSCSVVHHQFVYSWGSRALDKNRDGNFFISTIGVNYNLCNANGYIRKFFLWWEKENVRSENDWNFCSAREAKQSCGGKRTTLNLARCISWLFSRRLFTATHLFQLVKNEHNNFFFNEKKNMSLLSFVIHRLEMCRDRHDQRSWKNISNCVIFSWKQRIFLQNLRINMKFTHLFSKFTHPFLQSYWNVTFSFQSIIYIEIYAVLLLAILVLIYTFLVCKIFGPRIRSCKNISNCVKFPWKQRVSLQNLRINMKFTHLFSKFTHPFL